MKLSKRILAAVIPVALVVGVVTPVASSAADTEVSVLIDNGSSNQAVFAALVAAYQKANPTVKVTVNLRPGGADGDNLVKTKLATGEMEDVFVYNSGSLFQALAPTKNLYDMTNEPYMKNVISSYFPVVSADKKVYGIPFGTATGGGRV